MADRMAHFARGSGPITGAVAGVAGGIIGGAVYLSISGVVLGTLMGLSLGGVLVFLSSLFAKLTGSKSGPAHASPSATPSTPSSSSPISADAVVSTIPAEAGIPLEVLDVTQSEAQLLAAGRFNHYHLAKAKRLFEAKNFKEAAYQASASLSHGTLAEAAQLRKLALASAGR